MIAAACLLSVPGAAPGAAPAAAPAVHKGTPIRQPAANTGPASFRIVATDTGFEAPAVIASGLRHVLFENHGAEIHEAMLVKLPEGISAKAYIDAIRAGALFPAGALDYSGPGLLSPGETVELWTRSPTSPTPRTPRPGW